MRCHFCGNDLAFAARPEQPPETKLPPGVQESKFDNLYRGVACFWVVNGVLAMLVALEKIPPWASPLSNMLVSYLGVALTTGFLITILGIGMLVRVPLARQVVGAFCWFRLAMGLLGLGILLRTNDFSLEGKNVAVLAILNLVDTAFAAFQLWLLSVTDYEVLRGE